jgi:hypothetical protein
MKSNVLLDAVSYIMVEIYRCYGGTCCPILMVQKNTKPHGAISQNTAIFIHVAATVDHVPSQMCFEKILLAPDPSVRLSFCLHGTARLLPVLFS